jgi:hypothetical protein
MRRPSHGHSARPPQALDIAPTDREPDIAAVAAALIAEQGIEDYGLAKRKALERLRLPPRTPLPDDARLIAALRAHLALFGGDEHRRLIEAMRLAAADLMQRLEAFQPHLAGPVLLGVATDHSEIELDVFSDDAKALDFALFDLGIEFDHCSQAGPATGTLRIRLEFDGFPFLLAIHPLNQQHRKGSCARPRATLRELGAIMRGDQPSDSACAASGAK